MAVYEIEIRSWEKFNPRKDLKSSHWFRLENSWITDPDFADMTAPQKMVWLFVLSEASKRHQSVIKLSITQASRALNSRTSCVQVALNLFQKRGLITLKHINEDENVINSKPLAIHCVTRTSRRRNAHVPLRNETNETNETERTTPTPDGGGQSEIITPEILETSPDPLREVAAAWLEFAKQQMPWRTPPASWSVEQFAKDLARVQNATGLTPHGLSDVLKFVSADDFWRDRALSPVGLLSKSERNGQRKIDNILLRMKPKESESDRVLREYAKNTAPVSDKLPF